MPKTALKKIKTSKVISDPLYGIIDIRPVIAMVETEEFQALGDKKQLGLGHLVFPSATHTRKSHSIGSYHATRELADQWLKRGTITPREADALAAYALYHDIGHPPLSHITEPLCAPPKDIKGVSVNTALSLAVIRRRKKEIESAGVDFKLVEAMAAHKNPLHYAVSDKNVGMEKLDYLERDGLYTILSRPIGIDYLRKHIYFTKYGLAIDEKVIDNAIEAQNFYLKMYKNVYLRKTAAIAQRMLQKMTYLLIKDGVITPEELRELTDSELIGMMKFSINPIVKMMYGLFRKRDLYREAIVIRPERFARTEERIGKSVTILSARSAEIKKLSKDRTLQLANQEGLMAVESAIAKTAGIPSEYVLVVPITSPERFEARDILIYRGKDQKPGSLKARYPAHFKNIEEVAEDYLTFRVVTTEKYRAKLSSPATAKKVFSLLLKH